MLRNKSSERSNRERETYNKGLKRGLYQKLLSSHSNFFWNKKHHQLVLDFLKPKTKGKVALELGSTVWKSWIQDNIPEKLVCINISEVELSKGVQLASDTKFTPKFILMDANNLEFDSNTFDAVFGHSILHHLEFTQALDEISRVLKPDGIMVFIEPLGINPIGKIVRFLTPKARTHDEQPLRFKELFELSKRFSTKIFYAQFLTVLLGIISQFIFKNPDNLMMRTGFIIDELLLRIFPPVKYLYRSVVIVGSKKSGSPEP